MKGGAIIYDGFQIKKKRGRWVGFLDKYNRRSWMAGDKTYV